MRSAGVSFEFHSRMTRRTLIAHENLKLQFDPHEYKNERFRKTLFIVSDRTKNRTLADAASVLL